MKSKKIIALIVFLELIINLVFPCFSLAINQEQIEINTQDNDYNDYNTQGIETDDSNNENEIKREKAEDNENNVEDIEEKVEEEKKETEERQKQEEIQLETEKIQEKQKQEERQLKTMNLINEDFSIYIENNENIINSYDKNGDKYLFVPKDIDLSELVIHYTGNIETIENAELNKDAKEIIGNFENESSFTIILENGQSKNIIIMQSDVPAIFVNLSNNITINTVNSGKKDTKYEGSLNVTGCENVKDNISQNNIEFKGRGNTSWAMPKRSYQIKLAKKSNFLGIGNSKEKKWVLIANYQDPTLMKNKIINDLCVQSGLARCPSCSYADLYVNGDYVGNYLVCDKIEIKDNRINLSDPKGVLIELDNAYYHEEDYYFQSKRGKFYAVKEAVSDGNDSLTRQAMNSFKISLDALEDELYSSNPSWSRISKMIDVESFAKYYLINEFAKNPDEYFSSCYMYKDGDNDVIHMGPTWDYDASFGSGYRTTGKETNVDFTLTFFGNIMQRLYVFPEFAKIVNEIYSNKIKPILNSTNVNQISDTISKCSKINTLVWSDYSKYIYLKNELNTFVENRKAYFEKRYSNRQIEYSTHVENNGWMVTKRNGISGTEGKSLRVEGLKIEIGSGFDENISISYRSHVQDIGWQKWVPNGTLSGTTGKGLRVEAIQICLNNSSKYSIRYRVHIQDIGWQDWKYDGEIAGTEGQSKRIEAIEIQVIEGRNKIGRSEINPNALINYKAHIQDIGNTGYGSDGETIGTMGRSLRMEGIDIKLNNELVHNISLQIDAHVQDTGWIKNLTDGQYVGTTGRGLRMEAIKIRILGEDKEKYDIKYQVHVQDMGWQNWKYNGEMAGTEGQAKRIEAIRIQLIKK